MYDCNQPPPPSEAVNLTDSQPEDVRYWSQPEAWNGTDVGWGGYNQQLPAEDQDVKIKRGPFGSHIYIFPLRFRVLILPVLYY